MSKQFVGFFNPKTSPKNQVIQINNLYKKCGGKGELTREEVIRMLDKRNASYTEQDIQDILEACK